MSFKKAQLKVEKKKNIKEKNIISEVIEENCKNIKKQSQVVKESKKKVVRINSQNAELIYKVM